MRARTVLLLVAILLVAGFAAQNWTQINQPTQLTFGTVTATAPLGLILLTLLALTLLVFLASAVSMRTHSLVESRQHAKALQAQRDLAERAEASRFTDLRGVLDNHLREMRQREQAANTELDKTLSQHHRELRNQLEQMYHLLTSRMGELERRLDNRPARVERVEHVETPMSAQPEDVPPGRMVEPEPLHAPHGR
ncbi:hypothetical protein PE066_00255 [Ramlibacter tataouinensis]|uniref:hypothetical protein n=1 Tax=Ramlibacter tataouinensis TaxID=94132 RepID=UPI0022F3C044|nr:hypothetical protein [Ramlibacter tataouinensis]WBY02007.1 hypothetical protein PE066_00255 [Ramlibacter tataouinensis]